MVHVKAWCCSLRGNIPEENILSALQKRVKIRVKDFLHLSDTYQQAMQLIGTRIYEITRKIIRSEKPKHNQRNERN